MAAPKKMTAAAKKKAFEAQLVLLTAIVAAGANGTFTSPEAHDELVKNGFVEVNPGLTNEAGEIATRATQAGVDKVAEQTSTEEQPADDEVEEEAPAVEKETSNASGGFKIESGIEMPSVLGRGRGGNVYPFDQLEIGQSFFVPNSEDKPNASKSLASTVSSATARYSVEAEDGSTKLNKRGEVVPVMIEVRKFIVRSVEESGVKGARVWRTK